MCNIWLYFGLVIVPGVAYATLGSEAQVCYTKLGCFDLSPPYNHFTKLPASPEQIGTEIFLYTPLDKDSNRTIDWDNETSLQMSTFDVTLPVKMIVHGFANSNVTDWLYDMKNEFLKKGGMNVIIVTWGPGAAFPHYHEAVANTRLVARQVEMLIRHIVYVGVAYENIHLIGHSLGSHIAGHVGEIVKNKQQLLGRISGLDPAEPDFAGESKLVVLDPSDAMFVDVIHTSGAPLHQGGFGLMTPCGHVDFFINGGLEQPDCSSLAKTLGPSLENMLNLIGKRSSSFIDSLADTISCSHGRAHQVFTESINMAKGCQFTAYPCKSYEAFQLGECLSCGPTGCGVMGYMAEEYHARGNYFLNTRMSKPYCGHHYGIGLYLLTDTQTEGELHLKLNSSWGDSEWMNITGSTKTLFKGGHVMRSVTVSMDVVGRLHEVSLRFDQRQDGQHLRLGTLAVEKMTVISGESGHSYMVCLNRHLKNGEEVTALARPFSGILGSCPH